VSFRTVVDVDLEEFEVLSPAAKELGCMPSYNYYDDTCSVVVTPENRRMRAAGGHIHIALDTDSKNEAPAPQGIETVVYENRRDLVPILDAVVGNTFVLLDRDPGAARRRTMYGRAGEYRLPGHGLEYRTLSNFWLRDYRLMSFAFGLTRLSTQIYCQPFGEGIRRYDRSPIQVVDPKKGLRYTYVRQKSWDAPGELFKLMDQQAIRRAIDTNDYDLALENFQGLKKFLGEHPCALFAGLWSPDSILHFEHFLRRARESGLAYWFKEDPFDRWCNITDGHGIGWENFLGGGVATDYRMWLASTNRCAERVAYATKPLPGFEAKEVF